MPDLKPEFHMQQLSHMAYYSVLCVSDHCHRHKVDALSLPCTLVRYPGPSTTSPACGRPAEARMSRRPSHGRSQHDYASKGIALTYKSRFKLHFISKRSPICKQTNRFPSGSLFEVVLILHLPATPAQQPKPNMAADKRTGTAIAAMLLVALLAANLDSAMGARHLTAATAIQGPFDCEDISVRCMREVRVWNSQKMDQKRCPSSLHLGSSAI